MLWYELVLWYEFISYEFTHNVNSYHTNSYESAFGGQKWKTAKSKKRDSPLSPGMRESVRLVPKNFRHHPKMYQKSQNTIWNWRWYNFIRSAYSQPLFFVVVVPPLPTDSYRRYCILFFPNTNTKRQRVRWYRSLAPAQAANNIRSEGRVADFGQDQLIIPDDQLTTYHELTFAAEQDHIQDYLHKRSRPTTKTWSNERWHDPSRSKSSPLLNHN